MKPINISSLIKKYGPGYVAKNKKTGRVVAHSKKLDILFQKTKKKQNVVISWIPKVGSRFVLINGKHRSEPVPWTARVI